MSIYLMPFDCEVTTRRELRVFVDRGVVTAFTQYSWTDAESIFCTMSDRALASVAWAVDAFQRTSVHPLWIAAGGVASYVMDVELGWQGVCFDPFPSRMERRSCEVISDVVLYSEDGLVVPFTTAGVFGGVVSTS